MLTIAWLQNHSASIARVPLRSPAEFKDLTIYLGCGEVNGPGTVVQLDRTGNVLGTVQLPGTPYGLTVHKDGLVAAVPSGRPGKIFRIDGRGKVATLLQDERRFPRPIAIAAHPDSGDILIADNETDLLLLLPAGQPKNARKVLQITGHEGHLQDMSVAFTKDGHLLFGGSGPEGIYRFRAEKDLALGQPLLPDVGGVAADPTSKRWVAALRHELRVFEDAREVLKLPFPAGKSKWHDTLAFGLDGTLIMALHLGQTNYDVVLADFKAQTFRPLFSWNRIRVVSLAVGPKMIWKE
jgi:hypothetical protein